MLASRAATSRFQPHGLVPFWFWRQIRVTFSLQNARKAKNDGFPEPEPSAHIRREAIGRFCHRLARFL